MATIERVWPPIYKVMLVLTIVLVLLVIGVVFFVMMPLYEEQEDAQADYDKELGTIQKSEWDSSESGINNAMKLYQLAIGNSKDPAHKAKSDALLKLSTEHLQKAIDAVKEESKNPNITKDGKKTYSDQYDALKKLLQDQFGIDLVPVVYGMGRASEGNYYNMTLKLLLTKEVVQLLKKHNLRVTRTAAEYAPETNQIFTDPRERDSLPKIHASQLTVKPVVSYVLKEGEEPYLLEVSMQVSVMGRLVDFAAFAAELQKEGRWLGLTNLELRAMQPVLRNSQRAQLIPRQEDQKGIHIEGILANFTVCGYALPEVDKMQDVLDKKEQKRKSSAPEAPTARPIGI